MPNMQTLNLIEKLLADLDQVLENSPLEDLVARVNAQLPEERQQLIVPPLTLAQRTAEQRKLSVKAIQKK